MNLYQFINTVKQIVLANKDVNTFNEGDVYEIMNSGQHTYPATVLTINNITTNEQTHYQTINCVLFYIDRLTDDYSNKTMIMSQGFNVLKQIKDKAVESLPWTFETANYTPYTEKFGDLCAGVYLECTIVLEDDVICSDTSFKEQQLEVYANGIYSTIGYDTILVSVNEPVLHYIEINENGEYTPPSGVDGFSLVVVNVPEQKPEQTKTVTITENGTISVLPDEGSVLNKVDVTVNVAGGATVFHGSNPQFKGIEGDFPTNVEFPDLTSCDSMFFNCDKITTVPLFDTSNVTIMNFMFSGCSSLTTVPLFYTSNVTNMYAMFQYCSSLTSVPLFDTSKVTDMSWMFYGCYKLTSVPLFNTSNVTNMQEMFRSCNILVTLPQFDTSNVTNMSSMFTSCKKLTTVPQLDASNVTDISDMFNGCNLLTNFGGLLNIGQAYTTTFTYSLQNCKKLSKESIQNVIDGLYDMTAKGFSPTLKFNSTVYSKLTNEQKQQITNKNWTVAL